MTALDMLAALRRLAEAMISLRALVPFNAEQNAALDHACDVIVMMEAYR